MKYNVVSAQYFLPDNLGTQRYVYAIIDADGEPTGLTLPKECESVEMGQEFLEWCRVTIPSMDFTWVAAARIKELFADFLASREPIPVTVTGTGDSFTSETPSLQPLSAGQMLWMESSDAPTEFLTDPAGEQPAVETEEASGEVEYVGANTDGDLYVTYKLPGVDVWFLFHVESKSLVSLTFLNRGDVEGFLKWWSKSNKEHLNENAKLLHRKCFGELEQLFEHYKAETAEPDYRCPYKECVRDQRVIEETASHNSELRFVKCLSCGGRSPFYVEDDQPDESWIRKGSK